jgi:hypothetical protein
VQLLCRVLLLCSCYVESVVVVQFCKTSPYVYERVKQIKVTVGNDGTNDNVKVSNV